MVDNQIVIIGGGFYGLSIALFLRDELGKSDILVLEKESTMMSRASYNNQARVHNGYHYPRSILTGMRSAANFPLFVDEYRKAVISDFDKYYAISRTLSKVNARQFKNFVHKIGTNISSVGKEVQPLFNNQLVEEVYKVQEYAFDSHTLRDILLARIRSKPGIEIKNQEEALSVESVQKGIKVRTSRGLYIAKRVLNVAYSQMNTIHRKSNLPLLPLKQELAEMALIQLPTGMEKFSVTVMDGPFFSIMPFPSRGLHTLSHVRYTPHTSWLDDSKTNKDRYNAHKYLEKNRPRSNFLKMRSDVIRYIPKLKDIEYVDSLLEIKTVLQKSESDDSRPILFKPDHGIKGYTCIMGAKLDNIYDVFDELWGLYEKD